MFITFEGIDGSGKSTQALLLNQALIKMGFEVTFTREPGGTRISEMIRDMLLNKANSDMTKETELLLYAASRSQHVHEVIRPALNRGEVVLCERFIDSTLAYQGYGCGLNLESIRMINSMATGGLKPDLTILLDVEAEDGLRRAALRRGIDQMDRIESRDMGFYKRVRDGYLKIAANDPERVKVLSTKETEPVMLHKKIFELYEETFKRCM